ncbi:hypothetical protein Bca4012_058091 [Brassica carinata]
MVSKVAFAAGKIRSGQALARSGGAWRRTGCSPFFSGCSLHVAKARLWVRGVLKRFCRSSLASWFNARCILFPCELGGSVISRRAQSFFVLESFFGSSSGRHSVPVFLHSVLGEGSSSISSLRAAFGFVEDCTCGYGAIFKGGVLYPFFYSACTLIESDDYKSETHRELATRRQREYSGIRSNEENLTVAVIVEG